MSLEFYKLISKIYGINSFQANRKKCSAIVIVAVARKMIGIIFNTLENGWRFKDWNKKIIKKSVWILFFYLLFIISKYTTRNIQLCKLLNIFISQPKKVCKIYKFFRLR